MKQMLVLVLLGSLVLSGCGMVYSCPERHQRLAAITDTNARQMVDDADWIMLAERQSYLSYWYTREVMPPPVNEPVTVPGELGP